MSSPNSIIRLAKSLASANDVSIEVAMASIKTSALQSIDEQLINLEPALKDKGLEFALNRLQDIANNLDSIDTGVKNLFRKK